MVWPTLHIWFGQPYSFAAVVSAETNVIYKKGGMQAPR